MSASSCLVRAITSEYLGATVESFSSAPGTPLSAASK